MDNLSSNVCAYYLDHFDELSFKKQFHFASRLFLWGMSEPYRSQLKMMRPIFTQHESVELSLKQALEMADNTVPYRPKNSTVLRNPYFERYPDLKSTIIILFRALFLDTIYGLDAREAVSNILKPQMLERMYAELSADSEAIAILSSYVINFFYLYQCFLNKSASFNPEPAIKVVEQVFESSNNTHLQLQIYLYTHCIIGESLFYSRQLPADHLKEHEVLFNKLESLIETNFINIKTDNKFEFLICARLLGKTTTLEARINKEAMQSISPQGNFIVDTINHNPSSNMSLDSSEHRNVLFIMSGQLFRPGQAL